MHSFVQSVFHSAKCLCLLSKLLHIWSQQVEAAFWGPQETEPEVRVSSAHRLRGRDRQERARQRYIFMAYYLSPLLDSLGLEPCLSFLYLSYLAQCLNSERCLGVLEWNVYFQGCGVRVELMRSHVHLLAWSLAAIALQNFEPTEHCLNVWKVNG